MHLKNLRYNVLMGRLSFHIPDILSRFGRAARPAAGRFPALLALGLVMAAAFDHAETVADGCALGMLLSVAAQLLMEMRFKRKARLAAQAAAAALALTAFPPLIALFDGARRHVIVFGAELALMAVIVFLLARRQGKVAAANCVVSAVVAGISSLCAIAGLMLVYYALTTLVVELGSAAEIMARDLCVTVPLCAMWPWVFIALAARTGGEISVPAAYRAVVMKILFPLAGALLLILYAYLAKCLLTMTMPVGKINPYVSIATAAYLFLYFASLPFEGAFLSFFRRYGALLMIPLLSAQTAAFAIRVSAYGYTPARAASLLYIIFSIISCALTLIRGGSYANLSFLALAAMLLLGSVSPLNIIDTANRSQLSRIMRIYRARGLLSDGAPVAEGAAEALTREEMSSVLQAWEALARSGERLPEWAGEDEAGFERTFGFSRSMARNGGTLYMKFNLDASKTLLDVSAYSYILRFESSDPGDGAFDVTAALSPLMERKEAWEDDTWLSEPILIPVSGGRTLMLTYAMIKIPCSESGEPEGEGTYLVKGYLCW